MLLYRLRMMQPAEIAKIAEIGEGLEHKIYAAARNAADFQTLLREIKSKRYPQSRLQRILINCLLGVTKALQAEADHAPYLRILGVRKESKFLLSLLSENAKAPVIISPADVQNAGLSLDIRATDIRALCDKGKAAGRDFTEKLHIL